MNIHKNKMLWYNISYCIRDSYERNWNMGKDSKDIEPGKGITQESTGLCTVLFKYGDVMVHLQKWVCWNPLKPKDL